MMPRAERQGGAALLAAMLVLTVTVAAALMTAFTPASAGRLREQRTLALMAQASDALVGFAATHGRLPRPARDAGQGREQEQPCHSEAACSGYLPWLALGLPASDSWGRPLRYSVTPAFTSAPLMRTAAIATKRVRSRDASGVLYFTVGQEMCTLPAQCAPAVILSAGPSDAADPEASDEASNRLASRDFVQRPASNDSGTAGGRFDDLLAALPLPTLYERMAAARTLP